MGHIISIYSRIFFPMPTQVKNFSFQINITFVLMCINDWYNIISIGKGRWPYQSNIKNENNLNYSSGQFRQLCLLPSSAIYRTKKQ